jgi:2,4-didehydro-3-deoxy-L-rhamnonate hydrolase
MRLANWADRLVITPPGVGLGRTPPRWLTPGDELVSRIEGIGELRHRFVAAR